MDIKFDLAYDGVRRNLWPLKDTAEQALQVVSHCVADPSELARYTAVAVDQTPPEDSNNIKMLMANIKVGSIVENCSLHAVRIDKINDFGGRMDDLECTSLFTGLGSNCSLRHCGIVLLDPEALAKKQALWDKGGKEALSADWEDRCARQVY